MIICKKLQRIKFIANEFNSEVKAQHRFFFFQIIIKTNFFKNRRKILTFFSEIRKKLTKLMFCATLSYHRCIY